MTVYLRWAGTVSALVILNFLWWKKLRAEYKEEMIYDLISWVFFTAMAAGIAGNRLLYHAWGWWEGSGIITGLAVFGYKSHKNEGDIWEWLDMIVLPVIGWGSITALLWERYTEAIFLAAGIMVVWLTKKTYRKWSWYKSGKPGAAGMAGIIWWGITQVAVAFIHPDKLYWGELSANQWIGSWIFAAALAGILLRSGRKLWPKYKIKKTVQ